MSQAVNTQETKSGEAMGQGAPTINVNVNAGAGGKYMTLSSEKKRKTALILNIFGGFFGLHLFYVGRVGKGLLYAMTGGLLCIGTVLDLIAIATGSFKNNAGAPLRQW